MAKSEPNICVKYAGPFDNLPAIARLTRRHDLQLFGSDSEWNFGKIFAAPREQDMKKEDERTYATVAPLAQDLGLDIDISW